MLNPFVATISTRGNAESVLSVLVLGSFWALVQGSEVWSAILFGLAVHLKIYPIVYALPFWLALKPGTLGAGKSGKGEASQYRWLYNVLNFFSYERIRFGVISGAMFILLGVVMYLM
jgi:phosphatidylinositol glycan class M